MLGNVRKCESELSLMRERWVEVHILALSLSMERRGGSKVSGLKVRSDKDKTACGTYCVSKITKRETLYRKIWIVELIAD